MTRKDREDLLKGLFIGGQGSDLFREQTLTQELGTLTQALQLAEKHESGMAAIGGGKTLSKPRERFSKASGPSPAPKETEGLARDEPERSENLSALGKTMAEIYQFMKAEATAKSHDKEKEARTSSWRSGEASRNGG